MDAGIQQLTDEVQREHELIRRMQDQLHRVVIGQKQMIDRLLMGLLCNGHILLEGVPGLAKTLTVSALAQTINTGFQRIQFTPDLLPADLIGTMIYQQKTGDFVVKKGPIFSNVILADEINRAPAKVQSALLEAMQERQISIGEETFKLEEPFIVLATQNPIEQEGTYPLPEAQVDRFMFKVLVTYPSVEEERTILDRFFEIQETHLEPQCEPADIFRARKLVRSIYIEDKVKDYIVRLVNATRQPKGAGADAVENLIDFGASPRASIYLMLASKAHAFLRGRAYVTPDDVKSIGPDVLRHRVILSYEAEAEEMTPDMVVRKIFDQVETP
ncbi:MoxR family ATPase [Candidatus Sumerlaeota bacterium]|nr:MoxR family ATPase [Candidatus Sumerlaeota bacterium]